jgi:hypothetical protein
VASRRFSPDGDAAVGAERTYGYRLVAIASGIDDLVESAGGFLCDQARAGWDVTVLLGGHCDARALTILGIAAGELDADCGTVIRKLARGGALAVGADLLAADAHIREDVSRVARRGLTKVTVWGGAGSPDVARGLEPAEHPLSPAARAFKSHALLATGSPGVVDPVETLFRLRGGAFRALYPV